MIETLVPLKIPPGLFRNGTREDAAGRWFDGNLMRWVEGYPQPVGGWREAQSSGGGDLGALPGTAAARFHSALAWRLNNGEPRLVLGSNENLIVFEGEIVGGNTVNLTSGLAPALVTGQPTSVMTGAVYGAGPYGAGPYGAGSGALSLISAASWQLDTFGEQLVAVLSSDQRLLSWNAVAASLAVVSGAPTENIGVVVTPERFVVVLGAGGDARKVQWPDQETLTDWTPTVDNAAGDFILATAGNIKCGLRTKRETLIWTDVDLHTMTYIGGTLIYGFSEAGTKCGIIGPHAMAAADSQVYWMGQNAFFLYDGFVQKLPCEVHDYVFEDFNELQTAQISAQTNAEFGEVTWRYCSAGSTDINRYVTFNYLYKHWTFGKLDRTCSIDAGVYSRPIMVSTGNRLYEHEVGEDRGVEDVFLESGPIVLDPDRVMRIQRIVPDGGTLTAATMSLYTSMWPIDTETLNGPYSLANPTDVRLTARRVRLRVEEAEAVSWRVGVPELGVLSLGRR